MVICTVKWWSWVGEGLLKIGSWSLKNNKRVAVFKLTSCSFTECSLRKNNKKDFWLRVPGNDSRIKRRTGSVSFMAILRHISPDSFPLFPISGRNGRTDHEGSQAFPLPSFCFSPDPSRSGMNDSEQLPSHSVAFLLPSSLILSFCSPPLPAWVIYFTPLHRYQSSFPGFPTWEAGCLYAPKVIPFSSNEGSRQLKQRMSTSSFLLCANEWGILNVSEIQISIKMPMMTWTQRTFMFWLGLHDHV